MPPERLASGFLTANQHAVPIDGYRLFGVDLATRLINRLLVANEIDHWPRLEWPRDVYLTDNVGGRGQLIARFFREAFWPPLAASGAVEPPSLAR